MNAIINPVVTSIVTSMMMEIPRAVTPITVCRDEKFFEYSDTGRGAHIIPAETWRGDIVDEVAFYPPRPGRWFVKTGILPILGEFEIFRARRYGRPITLFGTPQQWLKASRDLDRHAVCVLDWDTDIKHQLRHAPDIQCESTALADRLHRQIGAHAARSFPVKVVGE